VSEGEIECLEVIIEYLEMVVKCLSVLTCVVVYLLCSN